MSYLSQLILQPCSHLILQPCSHLHPTHTKYHHLTSLETLKFNSFAINQHSHRFVPRCTGTIDGKGDTNNRQPDIRKLFEKIVVNNNTERDTDNRRLDIPKLFEKTVSDNNSEGDTNNPPPDIRKLFKKVVANKNVEGDTDNRQPDVRKLFEKVIMNKNIDELSELIDSSMNLSKVLTIVRVFHTKKQLLQLLFSLLAFMANHVEFVIKPSAYDGTNLGIKLNFEWKGRQIPLGKIGSLNIAHAYKGTLSLRKVNVLIEPIFHLMLKLKRIAPHSALERRRRAALYGMISLLLMTISFILLQKAIV